MKTQESGHFWPFFRTVFELLTTFQKSSALRAEIFFGPAQVRWAAKTLLSLNSWGGGQVGMPSRKVFGAKQNSFIFLGKRSKMLKESVFGFAIYQGIYADPPLQPFSSQQLPSRLRTPPPGELSANTEAEDSFWEVQVKGENRQPFFYPWVNTEKSGFFPRT